MTVIARCIAASPVRTASEAWQVIVTLLAPQSDSSARNELEAVAGIVCSLIAAETMREAPIVVWGVGPRVRFYCVYGEDAVAGDGLNEASLPVDATNGEWMMSLPCPTEELAWVQAALHKRTRRVTTRDMATDLEVEAQRASTPGDGINREAFFRS